MLIDTHAHLYVKQFNEDRDEMIRRAVEEDVQVFYLPNIDSKSIASMLALEEKYPDRCIAMMGLHPCSVGENYKEELALVREWLDKRPFAAVGEIGIDLYWDKTYVKQQQEAFLMQVEWAKELGYSIVIHSRESIDMVIDLLREVQDDRLRGVFHCFTGTVEQAEAIQDLGFYMGIGGVLTFKKAGLDETVKSIPLESLVLETDAPYLAPSPYRGKRNESAYVRIIAEKLAEAKAVDLEKVAAVTTENAKKLFAHTTN
jgi:TatD DNase family protein